MFTVCELLVTFPLGEKIFSKYGFRLYCPYILFILEGCVHASACSCGSILVQEFNSCIRSKKELGQCRQDTVTCLHFPLAL